MFTKKHRNRNKGSGMDCGHLSPRVHFVCKVGENGVWLMRPEKKKGILPRGGSKNTWILAESSSPPWSSSPPLLLRLQWGAWQKDEARLILYSIKYLSRVHSVPGVEMQSWENWWDLPSRVWGLGWGGVSSQWVCCQAMEKGHQKEPHRGAYHHLLNSLSPAPR